MAWTAPKTWSVGEDLSAADMNTELRDNLKAGFPTDAVVTTWAPSYTNLTVGNGTVVARYQQVGKWVDFYWALAFGSTSAMGTAPTISLPVTAALDASLVDVLFNQIGVVRILDAGSRIFLGTASLVSQTTFIIEHSTAVGGILGTATITVSAPMVWTGNDTVWVQGRVEVA